MDSLLIALLDKSGSMTDGPQTPEWEAARAAGLLNNGTKEAKYFNRPAVFSVKAKSTMEAFNHFLQVMKYRRDSCDFYMAQFAGNAGYGTLKLEYELTHNFVDLFEAAPLNPDTYHAGGGGTAIYDAIMRAIDEAEQKIASLPKDEQPTQVTMAIQTDGDDGNSHTRPPTVIAKMNKLRKLRWNFVFLGTGAAAGGCGAGLGFVDGKTMIQYANSGAGGMEAFAKAANAVLESLITGEMEV